jgi:hypothetical protein
MLLVIDTAKSMGLDIVVQYAHIRKTRSIVMFHAAE